MSRKEWSWLEEIQLKLKTNFVEENQDKIIEVTIGKDAILFENRRMSIKKTDFIKIAELAKEVE